MDFLDTNIPYKEVERQPIQYSYCVDFNHISRYKSLRQVIHEGQTSDRFVSLETTNPLISNCATKSYVVPAQYQNRLDLIAQEHLGSATYAWIIAYINRIADGFTVLEGTTLKIPYSVTSLFDKGELLAPISATSLNLGSE